MKKKKVIALPYLLLIPVITASVIFSFYPFFKTIISSFAYTDASGSWTGWAGDTFWKMMFKNQDFWKMLGITMKFAAANFIGTFVMAMLLALLSVKKTKLGKVYQMLYALPVAIASAISSVIWKSFFSANGILNSWLGTNISWMVDLERSFWVVTIVTVWCHIAGSYIYLLAGFRGVSEDLIEASMIDGANWFTRAVKIMIPMASPQIFFVLFVNIVNAIKTFTQIKLLTAGGPAKSTTTLMYDIYVRAIEHGEYEYACCLSIVLFVIIFLITRIQFGVEKKFVHYQ